jgi:hypothetical protein
MCKVVLTRGIGVSISEETENSLRLMIIIDVKRLNLDQFNNYALQGFTKSVITTDCNGEGFDNWTKTSNTDWKISALDANLGSLCGVELRDLLR